MAIRKTPVLMGLLGVGGFMFAVAADAQVVSIAAPRPYRAGCGNFAHVGTDVWSPTGPLLVNGHIKLGRGVPVGGDTDLEGFRLGAWLRANCNTPLAAPAGPFAGHCGGWLGGCEEGVYRRMP